jgi:hypothetical protein
MGLFFMMFLGCWLLATSYQLLASLVMVSGLLLIAYCFWLLGFRLLASVFLGGAGLQSCINTPE